MTTTTATTVTGSLDASMAGEGVPALVPLPGDEPAMRDWARSSQLIARNPGHTGASTKPRAVHSASLNRSIGATPPIDWCGRTWL
jgi:hypothetical protein